MTLPVSELVYHLSGHLQEEVLILGIDWEHIWSLYDGTTFTATEAELLTDEFWAPYQGATLLGEHAHFVARTRKSAAQRYTEEQLTILHTVLDHNNITLILVPEGTSPNARWETGLDREHMAEAYVKYYANHPKSLECCRIFPINDDTPQKHGVMAIAQDCTYRLNEMRGEVDYNVPEFDIAASIIEKNFDKFSENARKHLGIEKYSAKYRGGSMQDKIKRNSLDKHVIMSVYCAMFDENGELRKNNHGQFIGVDTVWRVLGQNAYKGKQRGTARSNVSYHYARKHLKPYVHTEYTGDGAAKSISYREYLPGFYETRRDINKSVKELIKVFRDN